MRQIFGKLLLVAFLLGSVFRVQAQSGSNVLVLDVYSLTVPSGAEHQKAFALWARSLQAGEGASLEHPPVIHEIYQFDRALSINKHYRSGEGSEEQISVVGRAEPQDGGCRVEFSELGRPRAYLGETAFTLAPGERRVYTLPAVEGGMGKMMETVVALEYKAGQEANGLRQKERIASR